MSSVLLGLVYGVFFANGFEMGLEYVLKMDTDVLGQWPFIALVIKVTAIGLTSFLAAYSSGSFVSGIVGGLLGITVLLPLFQLFQRGIWLILFTAFGLITCILISSFGKRFPLHENDILYGRFLGISWKHWLWLWIPWNYMVANLVWIAYPASILYGYQTSTFWIIIDVLKVPTYVAFMGWATYKAFVSLQAENGLTRAKSAFLFLYWFLLFPIIANILRLFKII